MREMKDSGYSWLNDIPVEWEMKRVKHLFVRKNEKAQQEDPTILSLARAGVRERDISNNEGQLAESYYNYNPVDIDDLLLNPMDLYSGANCSVSKIKGVISPAYVNLRGKENVNPVFYDYYFKVQYWLMAFFSYGKGVSFDNRWTLNTETLMNYPVVYMPYSEQCKRANYLDSKCSKIDEIIETETKVIEKLKAYKLSKINEIIEDTSGTLCHLGYISTMKNGLNFNTVSTGDTIKFLGVGDFKDYFVLNNKNMFSDIIVDQEIGEDSLLKNGDIIFVRSNGSKDLVGRAIMVENVDFPLTYSGFCIRFRNNRTDILNDTYLLYFFRSPYFRKQLEKYSQGSNISNINQALLSQITIYIPSIQHQTVSVERLNSLALLIDNAITKKQATIKKLTAYKKSLIYEVVTGKKEV